jgi:hypothetical protein
MWKIHPLNSVKEDFVISILIVRVPASSIISKIMKEVG